MVIFAKTIDHGSFRGAVRVLHLLPSVVGHQVAQLDENLGVARIYRLTRKLTLTGEGQRLLAATRNMLAAVEGELQDLSATAGEPSGELRITLPSVLSLSHITDHVSAVSLAYPLITLTLDFSYTRRALIDDGFDLAIRMGAKSKNSATSRSLVSVRRVLVASKVYISTRPVGNDPLATANWEWLALAPVQNFPVHFRNKVGEIVKVKPTPQMFTNDALALHRLAHAGAGLAIVPEFFVASDITNASMEMVLPG